MATLRKKFRDIFREEEKECLCLRVDIKVNDQDFKKGTCFDLNQLIAGVNFHKFRYLDLAIDEESGVSKIVGFYPAESNG